MKIEIITTENSHLKETGFGTFESCRSFLEAIEKDHSARLTLCSSFKNLSEIIERSPDFVVLAAKYMSVGREDSVWFSDYFNCRGIVFSGADRECLSFDSNKIMAKEHLANLGIRTARYFTAIPEQFQSEVELTIPFPLFLKPADSANGNGVDENSFVNTFAEFEAKVATLFRRYKEPVLVEEYLSGKEYTVAIIKKANGELVTSALEIVPPKSSKGVNILSAKVKYLNTEILKNMHGSEESEVKEMAIAAFNGLGIRGYGRIDLKRNARGECFFMEVNLVPGMNPKSSYFPKAFEMVNQLSYQETVCLMLDECIQRVPGSLAKNRLASGAHIKQITAI